MIKSELSLAANKLSHEYYHYNEFYCFSLYGSEIIDSWGAFFSVNKLKSSDFIE
ncbi:hypothetical protein ECH7EC4501_5609 [Escherichia coli O157:H7 str. EC4501]|nr:hypothetical protein ECH7EC4501_5609 [Escherichia coli O157:H7 str. EC4501]